MIDLDRHRSLLVSALHSHADHLGDELFLSQNLESATDRSAARQRIVREQADALDLAREIEST